MGVKKVLTIISSMKKEPIDVATRRGFRAEEKAFEAARYWRKKKLIKGVKRTEGFSPEDREGKDLIILLRNGEEIGIDVKTTLTAQAFKEAQERRVELFFVDPEEKIESVRERMLGLIIRKYFSKLEIPQIREIVRSLKNIKKASRSRKIKKLVEFLRKAF